MSKKIIFLVMFFCGIMFTSEAQNYKTGLGARLGSYDGFAGLTVKHFIGQDRALEGIVYFPWHGFVITGLYEFQKPFPSAPGLDWLIGGGLHIGVWDNYYYYNNKKNHPDEEKVTIFGADFILGLEYTFREVPFCLGLDWKPVINFNHDDHFWGNHVALSIRYTFK